MHVGTEYDHKVLTQVCINASIYRPGNYTCNIPEGTVNHITSYLPTYRVSFIYLALKTYVVS